MDESQRTVIELLNRDHAKIAQLLTRLDTVSTGELREYFCGLCQELVRHEVAEEMVVYPAFRKSVPGGDAIADVRIAEQAKAEEALDKLEREDVSNPAFRSQLVELRQAVLTHAAQEEREVFPALAAHNDRAELIELGESYEDALAAAPTHPHPHLPDTPPGNVLLGSIVALVDRFRDAMEAQRTQRAYRADEPMHSTDPR